MAKWGASRSGVRHEVVRHEVVRLGLSTGRLWVDWYRFVVRGRIEGFRFVGGRSQASVGSSSGATRRDLDRRVRRAGMVRIVSCKGVAGEGVARRLARGNRCVLSVQDV